ncbi:MAG: response regulator, partial [bacterium]
MKVLLVEDDLELANLVVERLCKFNPLFEIESISSGDKCLQKLSQNDNEYEAIILDSKLTEFDGLEFLNKMNQDGFDTPVVIVSGQENKQIGVEALKKGAYDYIVKDASYLSTLPNIVQNTIEKHQLETKLKELQSLILNSKKRLQSTFDGITDIIYQVNRDFEIIIANKAFAEQCHTQPENLIGKNCYDAFFHCQEACFDCPVKET